MVSFSTIKKKTYVFSRHPQAAREHCPSPGPTVQATQAAGAEVASFFLLFRRPNCITVDYLS